MGFFVRFWGTRGSIPTPGRTTHRYGGNTSCVEVRVDGTLFICDAGTGLRELGLDVLKRPEQPVVAHFLFSHMHWDHIQGFPFFVPAYVPHNTCCIYGTRKGDAKFHQLLSGQMRSEYFPVDFSELNSRVVSGYLDEGEGAIDGVRVRCFGQEHPGGSLAWSLEKNGFRVVYATDNEIDKLLEHPALAVAEPDRLRQPPAALVEFMRGADLLIADAQYSDEEYLHRVGWGHPRATTVVDLAILAGVRQLALSHHDPMQGDAEVDAKVETCRARAARMGSDLFVFAAREGLELRIDRAE